MDTDGNGTIDAEELRAALERSGIAVSTDEVQQMVTDGDLDNNGVMDRAEFRRLVHQKEEAEVEAP
jgi:Ca2+-binding EF-hand superfamily protein